MAVPTELTAALRHADGEGEPKKRKRPRRRREDGAAFGPAPALVVLVGMRAASYFFIIFFIPPLPFPLLSANWRALFNWATAASMAPMAETRCPPKSWSAFWSSPFAFSS